MLTFSIIHFHFKERSFYLHSKLLVQYFYLLTFQATLVVPSVGVWLFQKSEDILQSSDFCVIWNHQESFQLQVPDHHLKESVTNGVDSRNMHFQPASLVILLLQTQGCGQGLDCPLGLMWNGKKGFPTTVSSLVTINGPQTKIRLTR